MSRWCGTVQGAEASSALYWRGRIYEDEDKNFSQAANYYRSLAANYANFYYGILARQRLTVLGAQPAVAPAAALASVRKLNIPDLASVVPESDPHVIKARLLANAALNEYIGPELNAAQGAGQWAALAQAQIYASFGETTRALQSMKKSGISFFSLPTTQVPAGYWEIMFPHPYWSDILADANKQGLDPYFVAFVDSAGIGVQRGGCLTRACVWVDAVAAFGRQGRCQARRDEGFFAGHAAESFDKYRAGDL